MYQLIITMTPFFGRSLCRYFFLTPLAFLILFASSVSKAQSPGDIAPDAKYLPVDHFDQFADGFAIVGNNGATAIINATGDIVFPFNKYVFEGKFHEGMLVAGDGHHHYGYMNKSFKMVTPLIFDFPDIFQSDGYATNRRNKTAVNDWFVSISKTGALTPIPMFIGGKKMFYDSGFNGISYTFNDGLTAFSNYDANNKQHYGYFSRQGTIAIPAKFLWAHSFSEGLGAVSTMTPEGEYKWGFVDKSGKIVIPFKFSKVPENFSSGLALVTAVNNPEMDYAYINKTGEVIIKIKLKENKLRGPESTFVGGTDFDISGVDAGNNGPFNLLYNSHVPFQGNYALWVTDGDKVVLMGRDGSIKSVENMLKDAGIQMSNAYSNTVHCSKYIENETVLFSFHGKFGMIKTDGTLIIPPVFAKLSHFDPVSGLAYAIYSKDNSYTEGYINRSGVFVIVKKAKTGM